MKTAKNLTFIKVKKPDKELVTFLYKNFSFSPESLLSDYSKLFCKSRNPNKLKFNLVIALYGTKIVGWGIATENLAKNRKCNPYRATFSSGGLLYMLYVNKNYRKLGIASRIFKDLRSLNPCQDIICIGHDKISWRFFSKFKKIHKNKLTIRDWR